MHNFIQAIKFHKNTSIKRFYHVNHIKFTFKIYAMYGCEIGSLSILIKGRNNYTKDLHLPVY